MTSPSGAPMAGSLAADPFTSLAVHYGMLLGVSDFQVLAANPRGKLQLHQAWQHGPGIVWGYGVQVDPGSTTLRVAPGLAIDGLGREVSSGTDMCLDVHAWLQDKIDNAGFKPDEIPGGYAFSARLMVKYASCLSRPVPSVSSTCDGDGGSASYSRVLELAELWLDPYERDEGACARVGSWQPPADERDQTFTELRDLLRAGVLPPDLPIQPTDWLAAFRSVAAEESVALGPPGVLQDQVERTRLYPEDEPGALVLADLPSIRLVKSDNEVLQLTAEPIDVSVRRTLLPTWLIEELLAELLKGQVGRKPEPDAGGVRVARIRRFDERVTIELTGNVVAGTVPQALEVRAFDRSAEHPAWSDPLELDPVVTSTEPGSLSAPARVTFDLPAVPTADVSYRLILRGAGPTPLLGLVVGQPVPLAGWIDGPPASRVDGHDVVYLLTQGG
jgi:hypothetical protein